MPSNDPAQMRAQLRTWVLGKAKDLPADELTDQTPLFEQRYLRSIHIPELLLFLERISGVEVDVEDLRPNDFRDIDTLIERFCIAEAAR